MRRLAQSRLIKMTSSHYPTPDREEIRRAISEMAFRQINSEQSLNLDQELAGDEIQSILERLCKKYGVDEDRFWAEIDFDRYFLREFNLFEFINGWMRYKLIGRPKANPLEPFMIDDIIRIMQNVRLEKG